jgi:hypothetical protein
VYGGEIQNRAQSGFNHGVRDGLCRRSIDGQNAHPDGMSSHRFGQFGHGSDLQSLKRIDRRAEFRRVIVKRGYDLESALLETPKGKQCATQVAHADQQYVGNPVRTQDAADAVDELRNAIPDSRMSELSEIGEVFTYLRVGDVERLAEFFTGNRASVSGVEGLKLAEV